MSGHILKNKRKNNFVCIHEIIRLTIMKMKVKMKNRSHRHDINGPRLRQGHKIVNIESVSMMMLIYVLSNT